MIDRLIAEEALPADYREIVERHWQPLAGEIARRFAERGPVVVGINGAQGSGKSTLCRFLEVLLAQRGLRAATLSIDDLYLTRAERARLAREVHPLLATRGVPGTHDVALGMAIIDAFREGGDLDLPRFDKAVDDRAARTEHLAGPLDVLLFEGWCVGAAPQNEASLAEPVNALEAEEDVEGTWRAFVNRALRESYAMLFGRIDFLVMLKVEGFERVRANRLLQERKLAASHPGGTAIMDEAALDRFLMHYERLTRWMLEEMPARADVVIPIARDRRPA